MLQRPKRIIVIAAAVVAAALAVAVVERVALLVWAAETYLASHGYPDAKLKVSEFDFDRIAFRSIALGGNGPAMGRVTINSYRSKNFEIEIDDLRIPVELGPSPAGGGIPDFLRALQDYATQPVNLAAALGGRRPKILVRNATIAIEGLDGGPIQFLTSGSIDATGPELEAAIDGQVTSAHTNASYHIDTVGQAYARQLRIEAAGESDLAKLPWPAAKIPHPDAGHSSYKFAATMPSPRLAGVAPRPLPEAPMSARMDLRIDSVVIPSRVSGLAGDISLQIEADKGVMTVNLAAPAHFNAASVSVAELIASPIAAPLTKRLAKGVDVTLSAVPDLPLLRMVAKDGGWEQAVNADLKIALAEAGVSLHIAGTASYDASFRLAQPASISARLGAEALPLAFGVVESADCTLVGNAGVDQIKADGPLQLRLAKLRSGGLPFDEMSYAGPMHLTFDSSQIGIETNDGSLSISGHSQLGPIEMTGPVTAAVEIARLTRNDKATTVEATVTPAAFVGTVERTAGPPVPYRAKVEQVSVTAEIAPAITGDLRLKDGNVTLPELNVALEKIDGVLPFAVAANAGGSKQAAAKIVPGKFSGNLRSTASPALFVPLPVVVSAVLKNNVFDGGGRIEWPGGKAPLKMHYDLARRQGNMHVGPGDLKFVKGALQPSDLGPALAVLGKTEGTLQGEATFAYEAATGATSRGRLAFESLSFETAQVKIEGFSGALDFVDLLPPRTAPNQALMAKRINALLQMDDVTVHMGLAIEADGPVATINDATGQVADGSLALRNTTLRMGAASNAALVEINNVSLAKLFQQLGTDNVTGTGILTGSIPLRFGSDGLTIDDGKIRAQEHGVLHVNLGSAKETLMKQGQAMSLMVQALEDFRYTFLEIGAARPPGKDLALTVKLEGMNPAVLDGQPFRFNISLSGDLERLLTALQAGQGLTAGVLEQAIEVGK